MTSSTEFNLNQFDRSLIAMSLEYYINNKQPDPIAGGVPYQEYMEHLLARFYKFNPTAPAPAGE